ncbi:MAG: ABC transporter permease [Planctomycetes bacterium]|nr:ABC transporter permease [Planctomycetota bacterium]MBM4080309.1 ABC transporter permease [Planctomycetota bacterium]MBM4083242.1 ABC transporter permease [Planctomycetota bacterium]
MEQFTEIFMKWWQAIEVALQALPGVREDNWPAVQATARVVGVLFLIAFAAYLVSVARVAVRERHRFLAIALHTFREAVRKKVLLVLVLFGLIVIGSSPLLPALGEPEAKIRLMQAVCLRATILFSVLVAIFVAATGLPADISEKTVYSVLTKPVSRSTVIVGRILGLYAMLAVIVLVMGGISLLFIRLSARDLPEDLREGKVLTARRPVKATKFAPVGPSRTTPGGITWVKGGVGVATWEFTGLDRRRFPTETITVGVKMQSNTPERHLDYLPVNVSVLNPKTGESLDVQKETKNSQFWTVFVEFPPTLISDAGKLTVEVSASRDTDHVGAYEDGSSLFAAPGFFSVNLLKALVLMFFQCALVIAVAVMASTTLSGPVSVLLAFFVYLCGHLVEFMSDVARLMATTHGHGHRHEEDADEVSIFAEQLRVFLDSLLKQLAAMLPDLRRFDPGPFILESIDIPAWGLGLSFTYMLVYVLACFAMAHALFQGREIQ